MKTYLIFFGKSQAFIFHAFDRHNYIDNFSNVIKDFELLESDVFNIDDISNKEILAKYNFKSKQGRPYSLIKLYSFAQAFSSERIAGSIYGVALLSEANLTISQQNLELLRDAKENFAKLSLNGLKFNKSDFKEDVFKIWNAVLNLDGENYFNKLTYSGTPVISTNNIPEAFYVNSLFEDPIELNDQIKRTTKIYFSQDLEHLKRCKLKWPNNFIINQKVGDHYIPYKDLGSDLQLPPTVSGSNLPKHSPPKVNTLQDKVGRLEIEISEKTYEISQLKYQSVLESKSFKRNIKILIVSSALLFLIVSFASYWIWKPKPTVKVIPQISTEDKKKIENEIKFEIDSSYHENFNKFLDAVVKLNDPKLKSSKNDVLKFTVDFNKYGTILKIDSARMNNLVITTKNKVKLDKNGKATPKQLVKP